MNPGVPYPPCVHQLCATCSRERRKDFTGFQAGFPSGWLAAHQSLVPSTLPATSWLQKPQAVRAMGVDSFFGFQLQAESAAQMWLCPLSEEDGLILLLEVAQVGVKERLSISPCDRRLATMAAVITFAPVAVNFWNTKIN